MIDMIVRFLVGMIVFVVAALIVGEIVRTAAIATGAS